MRLTRTTLTVLIVVAVFIAFVVIPSVTGPKRPAPPPSEPPTSTPTLPPEETPVQPEESPTPVYVKSLLLMSLEVTYLDGSSDTYEIDPTVKATPFEQFFGWFIPESILHPVSSKPLLSVKAVLTLNPQYVSPLSVTQGRIATAKGRLNVGYEIRDAQSETGWRFGEIWRFKDWSWTGTLPLVGGVEVFSLTVPINDYESHLRMKGLPLGEYKITFSSPTTITLHDSGDEQRTDIYATFKVNLVEVFTPEDPDGVQTVPIEQPQTEMVAVTFGGLFDENGFPLVDECSTTLVVDQRYSLVKGGSVQIPLTQEGHSLDASPTLTCGGTTWTFIRMTEDGRALGFQLPVLTYIRQDMTIYIWYKSEG